MKRAETQKKLVEGTIRVIARGLDKATTKSIGLNTTINEAYIYRCFDDKEDMFVKTFTSLDRELCSVLMENLDVMWLPDLSMKERCYMLFHSFWRFLLGNKDKCLCFVRYYYSPYFQKYSSEGDTPTLENT